MPLDSELVLTKVEAKYRLNNMWIFLQVKCPSDTLSGKKIKVYVHDDKAKFLRKIAAKKMFSNTDTRSDSLWTWLAWSEAIVLNPENYKWHDGTAVIAIKASSRDVRKLYAAGIEIVGGNHFTTVFNYK